MKLESDNTGDNVPLLADTQKSAAGSNSQNGSIPGAVFNISTTMIGAGIMSIPATMKVLGIVPGFLMIVSVALATEITVEFMLRYTGSGKSITYAGMVGESYGKLGSLAVKVCVIITNLGVLTIYLIILDSLRYSSGISILLALVFVAISSSMAFYGMWFGKTQPMRIFPDFSQVSILDVFATIPVFVTGFGFHVNVHPIRAELGKAGDMKMAVRVSLIICVAIYFAIGFFGYLLFGDSILTDMLVNFDQSSNARAGRLLNDVVRLSYALHLALVFPVMNYSLRLNIHELLFSDENRPDLASDTPRFLCLTLSLLAFTYVVAVALPNIWYFFQFLGSTTIVCLSFIFPSAIILRDIYGIATAKDRVMAIAVAILAVVTSGLAIWTNLYG
ncbi:amino acid transporter AVT6C-like isoform X3 [Prosopis cineraria]|uniref:amino acid transporter AVT6C-like isoform X3 n=1 Tax=Prosopis cineraria TaxID=364024 RepID=UPI00240FDCAB|nr:amino acid transporter AVT6C-like isoform X3 [Prosopis cineraria]XP_054791087.1 amino acid transporter AVT6C-like isoform X3 [Prosopis cineraria]XP_054795076.1 amino acid transporter AVT6C-like isoform X3 [Prosopis cineraria]